MSRDRRGSRPRQTWRPLCNGLLALVLALSAIGPAPAFADPGDVDEDYGDDGFVHTDFDDDDDDEAFAAAIQTDNRVVVVGRTGKDVGLARYNTDGSLDGSFGASGRVSTDFGGKDKATGVAIQGNGKMVIVGSSKGRGERIVILARYNTDGSLDGGFDGDGKVVLDVSSKDKAEDVKVQGDGKIVIIGTSGSTSTKTDFLLARFNANGSLDGGFGSGGIVRTDFGNGRKDRGAALALSGSKIVIVGTTIDDGDDFAVLRYNSDGSLDTSFDGDGRQRLDFEDKTEDQANAVAIQSDGKIVVVGSSAEDDDEDAKFAVARFNTDGSLDDSFSSDGWRTIDIEDGRSDVATAVVIQSDGKIVLAGTSVDNDEGDFVVVRLETDGDDDEDFGGGDGAERADFDDSNDRAEAVVLQSDGKIVLAGTTNVSKDTDFGLIRYLVA